MTGGPGEGKREASAAQRERALGRPIRVLVGAGASILLEAVQRVLAERDDIVVIGAATSGPELERLTLELRPDVVLADIGLAPGAPAEMVRRFRERTTIPVLLLSNARSARATVRALEAGAIDFIDVPRLGASLDLSGAATSIVFKVRSAAEVASARRKQAQRDRHLRGVETSRARRRFDVVLIGSSTGGPRALVEILSHLPNDFGAAIVIAQHMPSGFTRTFAERLNRCCALHVAEASDGDRVVPGSVLLAPGGSQTRLEQGDGELVVRVDADAAPLIHRPSVDHLFLSGEAIARRAIAVVLTGMGDDGARGTTALHAAGALTIVESPDTAIVFGMPRAAAAAADHTLRLEEIGPALASLCPSASRRPL